MLIEMIVALKTFLHTSLNNVDRRATIQDGDFICGLIHAVAQAKKNFSLSDLRLFMCTHLGVAIGASAFNERLGTASLVFQLRGALEAVLNLFEFDKAKASQVLADALGVSNIVGIDGSLVTLVDGLAETFRGAFTLASLKLHFAVNLVTGHVKWFDITPGATHDSKRFPGIVAGTLYVFDLGYWSMKLGSTHETEKNVR